MSEDERNQFSEEEIGEALNRFKKSLISGRTSYFDVSEFEGIVEHLLEEGDINASEIAAKQGIQIHPNAIALHLKYAQVLLNKGKFEAALKQLKFVENVESGNPDVYLIQGSAWLVMGEMENAKNAFRNAIKYAGNDIDEIYYHIGSAYVQSAEVRIAIEYFEKAVQQNPKNEVALYELGFFCDQIGEFDKSIKYYNRYLDIDPFNYSTWFNLGITLNRAGNHEKAIEAYEYALTLNDEFHQSIFNIANAHANAGNYREAIKKYTEYLEIYPENDDAFCYVGECYLNLNDYTNSEWFYQKAIKQNKENDTAWFGVGLIMWVEKKYPESVIFIKKALKIDGSNSEYWLTLGKVNLDFNQVNEAIDALKNAIRLEPSNSEIWLTWVDAHVQDGEINKAIRILALAIQKNKSTILKYKMVGLNLVIKNETRALEMLKTALNEDFTELSFLFDFYPKAAKNRKIKRLIEKYREKNGNG